jgi:MerR family transcriptional regulator/heat shock protein HspR
MRGESTPLYTIGTAAELLRVHPRTLRLYEQFGLLRPSRKNNRRFYSENDIKWVQCIRYLIHNKGLNQEGLRRLLGLIPCWELKGCSEMDRAACTAFEDRSTSCWEIANSTCAKAGKCFECETYLSARHRLLNPDELQEIDRI